MTVSTFVQPNSSSQVAAQYPGIIDSAVAVLARFGDNFAPHAQTTPNMTIALDAGHLMFGANLIELAAQSTTTITAPSVNPRIDRVIIDNASGIASIVTGTEATTPVAPSVPSGKSPVALISLTTSTASIVNSIITDDRDFTNLGISAGGLLNIQTFSSSGTYTPTPGTTKIVVEVQGGGGSAGGCAATSQQ